MGAAKSMISDRGILCIFPVSRICPALMHRHGDVRLMPSLWAASRRVGVFVHTHSVVESLVQHVRYPAERPIVL